MSRPWSNVQRTVDMAPPAWWLRFVGMWTDPPSDEFEQAARQAGDREDRIDALELRVKVIERRLKIPDDPASFRKPA